MAPSIRRRLARTAAALALGGLSAWAPGPARAQIDPSRRLLLQSGVTRSIDGRGPLMGYVYAYLNQPKFMGRADRTLRLAVAPVYADAELGLRQALGTDTHFGLGLAGGGWADSYSEMRDGAYLRGESFTGHGAKASASAYHDFPKWGRVPLAGIFRLEVHHAEYHADKHTEPGFLMPPNQTDFNGRAGLRFGGQEPVLLPTAAFEFSLWHETRVRTTPAEYGYAGDRRIERAAHLFWTRALLTWDMPKADHHFQVMTALGTSVHADRFSAYRLGGMLPLASEFPLPIPGYFYDEVSARAFFLATGGYLIPLSADRRTWRLEPSASTAVVDALPGAGQRDRTHAGLGLGLTWSPPRHSWQALLDYGYGVNASRSGGGAHAVGLRVQIDLFGFASEFAPPEKYMPGVDRVPY